MKQTIQTLKNWFRRGMYPTEQQFADAFDSYRHKDDTVSLADLDTDVLDALNAKADNVALQAETQAREQALATKANAVHEHEVADVAELQETLDRKVEVAADKTLTTTVDAPTHEGKSGSYQTIVEEPITVRGKLTSKTYGNTSSVKVIYVNGGETLNIDAPRGHLLAVTLTGCTDDNTREQPLSVEVSADGETWEPYAAMPETEPFANRKAEPTTVTLEFDEPVSHLRFAKPSSSYISLGFLSVTHVREVRATNLAALTDDGNVTDSGIAPADIEEMRQDIDGKADVTHTHAIADVNGLQATLDEHTTDIQDLRDYKADIAAVNAEARAREQALALKADVTHTHAIADVNGLGAKISNLNALLNAKADATHTHHFREVRELMGHLPRIYNAITFYEEDGTNFYDFIHPYTVKVFKNRTSHLTFAISESDFFVNEKNDFPDLYKQESYVVLQTGSTVPTISYSQAQNPLPFKWENGTALTLAPNTLYFITYRVFPSFCVLASWRSFS